MIKRKKSSKQRWYCWLCEKDIFNDRLESLNKKVKTVQTKRSSDKTKHVLIENKLKKLQTFDSRIWRKLLKAQTFTPNTVVNLFIAYELDTWSWDLTADFTDKYSYSA